MDLNVRELTEKLEMLCRAWRACMTDVERRAEGLEYGRRLERLSDQVRERLSVAVPELLLACLEVYEVTRDESLLQAVLDVVSHGVDALEISEPSVRLLALCGYYTEEEECGMKARRMLEELKQRGIDVRDTEQLLDAWL